MYLNLLCTQSFARVTGAFRVWITCGIDDVIKSHVIRLQLRFFYLSTISYTLAHTFEPSISSKPTRTWYAMASSARKEQLGADSRKAPGKVRSQSVQMWMVL